MEATLKAILKEALGDFVLNGLEHNDMCSFPLELRDIELNAKRLNHHFDECHNQAIELACGKIGSVKVAPGWMGNIKVVATDIELNFSFSPTKAMSNGMRKAMGGEDDTALAAAIAASMKQQQQQPQQEQQHQQQHQVHLLVDPPAPPTSMNCPRFCASHDSSEKRVKCDPAMKQCLYCGTKRRCTYKEFFCCPSCADMKQQCMICGTSVLTTCTSHKPTIGLRNDRSVCPNSPNILDPSLVHQASRQASAVQSVHQTELHDRRVSQVAGRQVAQCPNSYTDFFGAFFGDLWQGSAHATPRLDLPGSPEAIQPYFRYGGA
jgi:hypothetical protein